MSPSRSMRPPATKVKFSMSRSLSKAPETRSPTRSCGALITPEGRTTFCACSSRRMAL